jgi:hypothetical protein
VRSVTPVSGYSKEQEDVLKRTWRTLDAEAQRAVWKSVMHGEAVAHRGHRRLAVWLARRYRKTIVIQGAAGLATGLLAASLLGGVQQPPIVLIAFAVAFGLAQPFVARRRYRRVKNGEAANLPSSGAAPGPADPGE